METSVTAAGHPGVQHSTADSKCSPSAEQASLVPPGLTPKALQPLLTSSAPRAVPGWRLGWRQWCQSETRRSGGSSSMSAKLRPCDLSLGKTSCQMLGRYHPGLGREATGSCRPRASPGLREIKNGCRATPIGAKGRERRLTRSSLGATMQGPHPPWDPPRTTHHVPGTLGPRKLCWGK